MADTAPADRIACRAVRAWAYTARAMLSDRSSRPFPQATYQSISHRSLLSGHRARYAAAVESSAEIRPFRICSPIRLVKPPAEGAWQRHDLAIELLGPL